MNFRWGKIGQNWFGASCYIPSFWLRSRCWNVANNALVTPKIVTLQLLSHFCLAIVSFIYATFQIGDRISSFFFARFFARSFYNLLFVRFFSTFFKRGVSNKKLRSRFWNVTTRSKTLRSRIWNVTKPWDISCYNFYVLAFYGPILAIGIAMGL